MGTTMVIDGEVIELNDIEHGFVEEAKDLKEKVDDTIININDNMVKASQEINNSFDNVVNSLLNNKDNYEENLKLIFQTAQRDMSKIAQQVAEQQSTIESLKQQNEELQKRIAEASIGHKVKGFLTKVGSEISNSLTKTSETVKTWGKNTISVIGKGFKALGNAVIKGINAIVNAIDTVDTAINNVDTAIDDAIDNALEKGMGIVADGVIKIGKETLEAFKNLPQNTADTLKEIGADIADSTLGRKASEIGNKVADFTVGVAVSGKNYFQSVSEIGKRVREANAQNTVDSRKEIINAYSDIKFDINEVIEKANKDMPIQRNNQR